MKSFIRRLLVGNHTIREYATVTIPDNIQEKVYLEVNGQSINVSHQHWLLCIEPVVVGIWIEHGAHKAALHHATTCRLYFNGQPDSPATGPVEAVMRFTKLTTIEEEDGTLFLLQQEKSILYQVNPLKQYLLYRRYYRKNGLTFPRFKSFVAAYSYPRRIRVISFQQDDYYNIFPMDLLGEIGNDRYVFGLRHSNIALGKIMATGKLVVSEAPYARKDIIYRLGAHHSSLPPALHTLPFQVISSQHHGFPIPEWALSYREINVVKTINLGSHMLLWGAASRSQALQSPDSHLYLMHFLHYLHQEKTGPAYPLV